MCKTLRCEGCSTGGRAGAAGSSATGASLGRLADRDVVAFSALTSAATDARPFLAAAAFGAAGFSFFAAAAALFWRGAAGF